MIEVNFVLDQDKKFSIKVPGLPDKINYYYDPISELHKFDEAMVAFIDQKNCIDLKQDVIDEILCRLYGSLKLAIDHKLVLPNTIKFGCVGYLLNQYLNDLNSFDIFPYWMWSSNMNVATILYNFEDKIYFEIVPTYPWTFLEPVEGDGYITFQEFMITYKPYIVEGIPINTAKKWCDKSEALLKQLNSACL